MTLDRIAMCISASPSQGSPPIAASTRQFVLWDREFVALARLDHQIPSAPFSDDARDRASEVAVSQPIQDHSFKLIEGFARLIAAALASHGRHAGFRHCAAGP